MSDFELLISTSVPSKISRRGSVHLWESGSRETRVVGVTGLEPVTLRLSSACSNQLSYTPEPSSAALRRWSAARESSHAPSINSSAQFGGAEEIRTPDL